MVKIEIPYFPSLTISDPSNSESTREEISDLRHSIRRRMRGGGRVNTHLSWHTSTPRLVLTSDTDDFDTTIVQHFQEEGFQLAYLAYSGDREAYMTQLQHLQDPLELGEKYAIVAYGDAAAHVLEACQRPMPKLVAVVAYYPPHLPRTIVVSTSSPATQIHLAGSQKFGTSHHAAYRYPGTSDGFAEHDLDEFDEVSAGLAWSRALALLRRAFDVEEPDLEALRDAHSQRAFSAKDAGRTLALMTDDAHVLHGPTLVGGVGPDDLKRFYEELFAARSPSSMRMKLLSRTVGSDRVVDEIFVSLTHSVEIPWLLPGVPPTDKRVEIVLVSIVGVRGMKVFSERVYWDQASVLVQVGLLDPSVVPASFTASDENSDKVERLPVLGNEAARMALRVDKDKFNELIEDW